MHRQCASHKHDKRRRYWPLCILGVRLTEELAPRHPKSRRCNAADYTQRHKSARRLHGKTQRERAGSHNEARCRNGTLRKWRSLIRTKRHAEKSDGRREQRCPQAQNRRSRFTDVENAVRKPRAVHPSKQRAQPKIAKMQPSKKNESSLSISFPIIIPSQQKCYVRRPIVSNPLKHGMPLSWQNSNHVLARWQQRPEVAIIKSSQRAARGKEGATAIHERNDCGGK